ELGRLGQACIDAPTAIEHLEESVFAAEASHHDELAIAGSVYLAFQHAQRAHDVRMGKHWVRHGEAILARFPGHPLLEAWITGAKANVLSAEGLYEESLKTERRALALKESALGPQHIDVAISTMNVSIQLHELGRDAEAEPIIARAVDIYVKLLGD